MYSLELISEINKDINIEEEISILLKESGEILAIIVASIKTSRENQNKK